ncbi:MAG: hypothetical protein M1378_05800 [Bacteroidetes bacterium]|nr:hypothetical protein [Bacteroidota bacterium]
MEREQGYNGWSNYETWACKLWIDNDAYEYWDERTREICEQSEAGRYSSRRETATRELADAIRSEMEDNTPETVGLYADLLNAALSEVNYREIAEALISDLDFDFEETEETHN